MEKLKLVSYRRISNERPDGTSLMEQARCIGLRIEADGNVWQADFHDIESAESAATRPGFQQALKYIYDGHADGLVVFKIDRFARNVGDGVSIMKELRKQGKSLLCVRDSIDTSSSLGEAMFQIALVFGELELKTISERTQQGRLARTAQGRYGFGCPPAFHEVVLIDGKKTLVPTPPYDEVRNVILSLRERGVSWRGIARELTGKFPPPGATRKTANTQWNATTVKGMAEGDGKMVRWVQSGYGFDYGRPLSPSDIEEIIQLRRDGLTLRAIAKIKDVGQTTIGRIVKTHAHSLDEIAL